MEQERALRLIKAELKRARKKFPTWPDDRLHQAAIVCEESGELIRASLQWRYDSKPITDIENETIQCAAMCIRLLTGR